jgi:hypothetical protein
MRFDSQLEEYFYNQFKEQNLKFATSKKIYDIRLVKPIRRFAPYDFSIEISNRIIGLIEIKSRQFIDIYDYSKIEKFASENNVRYIILSDTEKFIVTDRKKGSEKATLNFIEFIELIQERDEINIQYTKEQIASIFKSIITESKFAYLKNQLENLLSQILNGIEYNEIDKSFSFKNPSDINNIENKIFRFLLKDDKPLTKVYRYTTLSTIYSMLNYNSFRMNCLVGMNDTTEVNYAENYVTGTNRDYTQAHWRTVDAYNRRFISSCSLKDDDLTQWRLYADDSKGVCLVLNVNQQLLNSKFVLKRISYGEKDNSHPELDLIKKIIATIKDDLGVDFEFKTLNIWKHFFKPYDYGVEEEVRLLFIMTEEMKKGWLLTASHNILNPFVEFKLNDKDLPLQMTEILLGPKCPEKEINQKQFEQYIRELNHNPEYNISKLKVSISKIKNYR